jgi:glycosyltransferase involved in cell wall biosynthesis
MTLLRVVKSMRQHSHVVISLTTVGPIGKALIEDGHVVHSLQFSIKNLWRVLLRLWLLIRNNKPDVVQTWMYHADLLGGVIARLAGVNRVVWNVRNTEIHQGAVSIAGAIVRLSAGLSRFVPKAIVCCARAGMARHIALGYDQSRMFCIPNGYDLNMWEVPAGCRSAVRADLCIPSDAFVVGIVGRYDPIKSFDIFVMAAGQIARVISRAVFVLIGRQLDENNDDLGQLIALHGSGAKFRLLGERPNVKELMSVMDVFCLSSKSEGFPNVVAEAMMMKLPCVVTDVGDAAHIVGPTGYVVPAGEPGALAEGVLTFERIGELGRREVGLAARQRIADSYDIKVVCTQYELLYKKICTETEE